MSDSDCIFCKIANGEIPSKTLYEDASFRVIFDINPASLGHAVILPKRHAANIYDLNEQDAAQIFVVAKKVASALKKVLPCEGMNLLQNNGECAGQTVFHLHMHIIPRYKDDMIKIKWTPGSTDDKKLDEIMQNLSIQ